jgi:hypothetical protein
MQREGFVIEVSFPLAVNFPGLPNATSVQQEMDINYGSFKSIVHDNLKQISSAFYAAVKSYLLVCQPLASSFMVGPFWWVKHTSRAGMPSMTRLTCHQIFVHGARLVQCPTPGSGSQLLRCFTMERTSAIPILRCIRTSSPKMTTAPPSSTSWDTKAMRSGLIFAQTKLVRGNCGGSDGHAYT